MSTICLGVPVTEPTLDTWISSDVLLADSTKDKLLQLLNEPLGFLEEQLTWKHGYSDEEACLLVEEYRKWLAILIVFKDALFRRTYPKTVDRPAMPSKHVDCVWHQHILFTKEYAAFCDRVCHQMIHHSPCTKDTISAMDTRATRFIYQKFFGPMPQIWLEQQRFVTEASQGMCDGSGGGCE